MNICKVVFYYIGILTVSIVFVKMLYELVTKKYKKKLVMDDSRKNTKIQYFQILFYIVGIIFSEICVFTIGKYSLQGTTQGRYLTGGVPPVRFSM